MTGVPASQVRWRPLLLALLALLLAACRSAPARQASGPAGDLTSQVLFTAHGTYDAQADQRQKISGGLRRVTWVSQPPLKAGRVVAQYDGDSRPQAWMLDITQPTFTAQTLAGADAQTVQTGQGQALRPAPSSRLRDTLILKTSTGIKVLTRGYVTQVEPELLGAF